MTEPEITVVVVTYNASAYLRRCIDALYAATVSLPFKLIVMNNASTDDTKEILKSLQEKYSFIVEHCKTNLGFCGAANRAALKSRGRYIVFLDDDAYVNDLWLDRMRASFDTDTKIGLVGCKILNRFNRIFSAEAEIAPEGPITVGYGEPDAGQRDYQRSVDAVIGTCQMFRHDVFAKVDGFDESFFPCQSEDTDICLKVRQAGYKVFYCGEASVRHENLYRSEGAQQRNLEVFREKWLSKDGQTVISKPYLADCNESEQCELCIIGEFDESTLAGEIARNILPDFAKLGVKCEIIRFRQLHAGRRTGVYKLCIVVCEEAQLPQYVKMLSEKNESGKIIGLITPSMTLVKDIHLLKSLVEVWTIDKKYFNLLHESSKLPVCFINLQSGFLERIDLLRVKLGHYLDRLLVERNQSIGFNIVGYARGAMGTSEALRVVIRCLKAVDIPFCIYSISGTGFKNIENEFEEYESAEARYPNTIMMLPIPSQPHILRELPKSFYKVGRMFNFLAWELMKAPKIWRGPLSFFDQVWTLSEFSKGALDEVTTTPSIVFLHAVEPPEENLGSRQDFSFKDNEYVFLHIFDYNSLIERKNPEGVIRAFQKAFRRSQRNVRLVIKTNNLEGHENEARRLKKLAKGWNNISFINETFHSQKVWSLINASDCLVSLHRAEGFGLTCAEAMSLGKPVIATAWSGNIEFMNKQNSCLVPAKLVLLKKDIGPYKKGNVWAEPDIKVAAQWMQRLFKNRKLGDQIGQRAQKYVRRYLSHVMIGMQVKEHMSRICKAL